MPDRSDEFRKSAAKFVAMARTTTDPVMRARLLTMAQRWYDMANGPPTEFDKLQRDFNDQQMHEASKPVMQQQQQIQPKQED
jgi:hypothetical protein